MTDIDVNPATTPETFTVVMVANAGAYKIAGWSWAVDRTAAQVAADLTANYGRLIDIDPYQTADVSDNRMTRGMVLRYGIANVDTYGHSIGMANTHLQQDRIGCLFVNGVRNQLTRADAGSLYEQVDNGSLLNPANESQFYSIMLGGPGAVQERARRSRASGGPRRPASQPLRLSSSRPWTTGRRPATSSMRLLGLLDHADVPRLHQRDRANDPALQVG